MRYIVGVCVLVAGLFSGLAMADPMSPPLLVVGDRTYFGEVYTDASWLENGSDFMQDLDSDGAMDFTLAGGIGAASFGQGVDAQADGLGAIGIGIAVDPQGPAGSLLFRGHVAATGTTQALGDAGQSWSDGDASVTVELNADFSILNVDPGQTVEGKLAYDLSAVLPQTYDITGSIEFTLDAPDGSGLDDISEQLFIEMGADPSELIEPCLVLDLPGGDYELRLRATLEFNEMQGDTYDTARGDFRVSIAIPEPTSLALLALGGLTLLLRR